MLGELFPNIAAAFNVGMIEPKFEKFLSTLCKDVVKHRQARHLQYNDVLNNLIEVAAEHPEMTDEMMYKTVVQFFTDGYETASQVFLTTTHSTGMRLSRCLASSSTS